MGHRIVRMDNFNSEIVDENFVIEQVFQSKINAEIVAKVLNEEFSGRTISVLFRIPTNFINSSLNHADPEQ